MPCAWKRRKWYEKKSEGALRQNCKNTLEGANKLAECICGWRDNIGRNVEIVKFGSEKVMDDITISLPYEDTLSQNKEVLMEISRVIEIKSKIDELFWDK